MSLIFTNEIEVMRTLGSDVTGRDLPCYEDFGKSPDEPLPGGGPANARLCMFGRDPGREEVRHGIPFVGAGGQKIRRELHAVLRPEEPFSFDASLHAGEHVFWANTVPFKPLGNKAWPKGVVTRFRPSITQFLLRQWKGSDVLAFGETAFRWFGHGDRERTELLDAHWRRDDRFETSIALELVDPSSDLRRRLRVHPVPHPSPLNATWAPHFGRLLRLRLEQLAFSRTHWAVEGT